MVNFDQGKMKKISIIFGVLIIGMIVLGLVLKSYAPPLPNYSDPNDPTLWQNTITDANGTQYTYRKEITISNPTDQNQTGTHGFKLQFVPDTIATYKMFKVQQGIVKLLKVEPNPDPNGASLLREQPVFVTSRSASEIMVYFDYEIPANSKETYYLYYGISLDKIISTELKLGDLDLGFLATTSVGYASFGGYLQDVKDGGFYDSKGFNIEKNYWEAVNITGQEDGEYNYYGETSVQGSNYPHYYQYGVGAMKGDGGVCMKVPIEAKNKYIRVQGDRQSLNLGGGYGISMLSLIDGNKTPSTGGWSPWSVPHMGVYVYPETDSYPSDSSERAVGDFVFRLADQTYSDLFKNPYKVKNEAVIMTDDWLPTFFLYEFFIDGNGATTVKISVDGYGEDEIVTREIGTIPWEKIYFQISSGCYKFKVKSVVVADSDLFNENKLTGVKVKVGYEMNLDYLKTLPLENGYTFIIGLITLAVVLIYFVGFFIPGRDKLVDVYVLIMIFISIFIVWRYHPIRYISFIGEESHWYFGDSEMGLGLLEAGGDVHFIFFYLLYLTFPLILWLSSLNLKYSKSEKLKQMRSDKSGRALLNVLSSIALIFLVIVVITLFFPNSLKQLSFNFMSIAIILLLINQFKDGTSEGKDAKDKSTGFFKKTIAYLSFLYFVIKIIIESYKAINSTDPFVTLEVQGDMSISVLGALVPILLGWGIPQSAINIIAIIFSDYLTIIIIGITFLKEAFQAGGTIFSKLSAGIWIVYLWFAVDAIHFPFFTMVLSILYVAAWLNGNVRGEVIDKLKEEIQKSK
jgi:hypothetical protein